MAQESPRVHNILIVDDIGKNIQVLASILKEEHYAISFATNGKQALRMIHDEEFDLILLDVMMPEMDGFEVCAQLQRMDNRSHIPVIFLTARTQQQDIADGFRQGAVDYITKPFNTSELKARVDTHLQLKSARDVITRQNEMLTRKNKDLERLNDELNASLEKIKKLEGILPICSFCKNIRDDKGYWNKLEKFIADHSDAVFSHSLCPDCAAEHYPEEMKLLNGQTRQTR